MRLADTYQFTRRHIAGLLVFGALLGFLTVPVQHYVTQKLLVAFTPAPPPVKYNWHVYELLPGVRPHVRALERDVDGNLTTFVAQDTFSTPAQLWGLPVARWHWLPMVFHDTGRPEYGVWDDRNHIYRGIEAVLRDREGTTCNKAQQESLGLPRIPGLRHYVQCQSGLVYVTVEFIGS